VTETVMLVNMGNRPHCDNGEGLAHGLPLTRFLIFAPSFPRAPLRFALGFCCIAPSGLTASEMLRARMGI
jgi:hypothetical protein